MTRPGQALRGPGILIVVALLLAACGAVPLLPTPQPTPEQPREVTVRVVERTTGVPVIGANLTVGALTGQTGEDGSVVLTAMRGASVEASADGHDPGSGTVPDDGDLEIELRANVVSGSVADASGQPIAGVRVFVEGSTTLVETDAGGRYSLPDVPETGTLIYKMPGRQLGVIAIDDQMTKDVVLPAFEARALYAPAAIFEGVGRLDAMLDLIDATEVNAMVIDVKETNGNLYWATDLPAAVAVGSIMDQPLLDLDEVLPPLKERGIYTIARLVVMKDNTIGRARPELAVQNSATGQPWRDYGGGVWLDPYNPGVAEYIAALAADLADRGFDEVQLDYVRFFSDGDYSVADTNLPNTQSFRLPAIRRLFRLVSDALETKRTFLGADVFPISFIAPDDQGIGQRPEVIMPFVDYFSPMVYPSHYGPGTFGFAVPNDHPYDVINKTLQIMNEQRAGLRMVIRPWIQDFGYGPFPPYSAAQVLAEMQAASDNGAHGWMIWNAAARFTARALGPPVEGEASAPVTSTQPAPSSSPSPTTSP
ncbi:MAG: carboxypeptidase regulatory-like domain-containing protein [Chloroflexota bacterium]|nr:carboxypeptidase regulatory-like domain-containing protein [Chloroflexota bacterium]